MWSPWSEEGGGEAGGWEQMAAGGLELHLPSPLDQDPRQELEPSTALHSEQPVRWRGSLMFSFPTYYNTDCFSENISATLLTTVAHEIG